MKFFWNTDTSCFITGQTIVEFEAHRLFSDSVFTSSPVMCRSNLATWLFRMHFSNLLLVSGVTMWPVLVPDALFLHRDTVFCKILATLYPLCGALLVQGFFFFEREDWAFSRTSSCKWIHTPSRQTWTFQNHQLQKTNGGVYGWFIVNHRHSSLRRCSIMYDISHLALIWTTAARLH